MMCDEFPDALRWRESKMLTAAHATSYLY